MSLSCVCPAGLNSILNEFALCGTLKFLSGNSVWFAIVNGLSISIISGLWTATIDAVNDELVKVCPFTFFTELKSTLGTAVNVPPASSLLKSAPDVFLINVPSPAKSGSSVGVGGSGCVFTSSSSCFGITSFIFGNVEWWSS